MNPSAQNNKAPYLGLRPFKESEKELFFGRDNEIHILSNKILANRLTLLVAASGVGKSSLLQAGVMPELRDSGMGDLIYHNDWALEPLRDLKQSVVNHLIEKKRINADYHADFSLPLDEFFSLHSMLADGSLIILLDQFEEFFNYQRFNPQKEVFVEQLAAAVRDSDTPCAFVFAMREDFAMELNAFKPFLKIGFEQVYRIEKLSLDAARLAITRPVEDLGYAYEPALLDLLLDDLGRRELEGRSELEKFVGKVPLVVEPPHLQIVCQQLWSAAGDVEDKVISGTHYQALARADGILDGYFLKKMSSLSGEQKRLASKAFDLLVSQQGAKMSHPLEDLVSRLLVDREALKETLELLQAAAILRRVQRQEQFWYELYHDIFAKSINEWNRAFKYRQMRRRFFVGLGAAVLAGAVMFSSYDFWVNHSERHLRLGKETVSDRVEVYQGDLGSWDLFSQQRFLFETDYEREDIEADKRFETLAIGDVSRTYAMQVGQLKLIERYLDYIQAGLFYKANSLADDILKSKENDLIKQFIQQLAHKRVQQSVDKLLQFPTKHLDLVENIVDSLKVMKARSAIKMLLKLLENDDLYVSKIAADALGILQVREAIPKLLKLLEDNDLNVRETAADALGTLQAHEAVPALLKLLENGVLEDFYLAIFALRTLQAPEAVPMLLKLLEDDDPHIRFLVIHALRVLQARETVPALLNLFEDDSSDVSDAVAQTLGELQARETIPTLLKSLKHSTPHVRKAAVQALETLQAREAIPALLKLLQDNDESVRDSAAQALGTLQAREAVPALLKLLGDSDLFVRGTATEALGTLQANGAVSWLLELLEDSEPYIRYRAIQVLRTLQSRKAVPTLLKLLEDGNQYARSSAAQILGTLQTQEAVPALLKLLEDSDWSVREAAAQALGMLQSREAIPALLKLFQDNESGVRNSAAQALGTLQAYEAVPALLKLLKNNEWDVRESAAQALGSLQAYEAVPALLKLLEDKDNLVVVNNTTAQVLGTLEAYEAIPILLEQLRYRESDGLESAIEVLGKLQVREAIPELVKLFEKDKSDKIGQATATALSRMQQKPKLLTEWQQQQLLLLKEKLNQKWHNKTEISESLGFIYTQDSVKLLLELLKDKHPIVIINSLTALGNIGEYHPQWLQAHLQQLLAFTDSPRPDINIAALKTLGQLQHNKGADKAENFTKFKQTIQQHLLKLITDKQQEHYIRIHALNALSQSPKATAAILELLKDETETDLHYFIYRWLGDNGDKTATKELQKHLQTLTEEKQKWRERRDKADKNQNLPGLKDLEGLNTEKQHKSWQKEYLEYKIAYAIAQIDPSDAGINLLNHPLYQARQAAIRALSTKTNGELIEKIFNYHQDFNEKDLPSPRPYAAYQALDKTLHQLESTGKQKDLTILKQLRADDRLKPEPSNKTNPSTKEQQREAIKQRLDWTIAELEYRIQKAENGGQKTDISATK